MVGDSEQPRITIEIENWSPFVEGATITHEGESLADLVETIWGRGCDITLGDAGPDGAIPATVHLRTQPNVIIDRATVRHN